MSPPTRAFVRCAAALLTALVAGAGAQQPGGAQGAQNPLLAPAQGSNLKPSAPLPGPVLEMSIEAAKERALENNLGLKIGALDVEIAYYNHRATWGAFDWVVDARAGITDAEFQSRDVFGGSSENTQEFTFDLTRPLATTGGTFRGHFGTTNTRTNSSFQVEPLSTTDIISLNYTQPLLRGAWREYATSRQRESELVARREDEVLRQTRQQLLLDVSLAYWSLVGALDALAVAESSLELAKAQVDQNQRRLEAGSGIQVEVLQAQAEVALREEARLLADLNRRKAADDLKQLVFPGTDKVTWDTNLVPTTPLPEAGDATTSVSWEVALAIAIERRAELRQQRLSIEAFDVAHERTRSERKAGLDLDLTASSQGFSGQGSEAFDTTASFEFPTYRAALVFNYAIGNRTARNTERAAWATLRAARLQYADLESQIVAEVRDGVLQVRYQVAAVRAADKSLELAQQQLAAEQARYANDLSTTFQVLQFQQDLAQAMTRTRATRANYAKALATLAAAQGLLGDTQP